ncbi:alanine racemase C-terminal domain-containing protein [Microbacterium esteraromaticum]|nr:alanine racemase C-terminal domain-containing protein [Microbacterium esteraromaticum]
MASSSAPRVILDRRALMRNAGESVRDAVIDLRHDAYGHGVVEAARIVMSAGAASVLVDDDDIAMLAGYGISASAEGSADIGPHELFGIPEGSTVATSSPVMRLEGHVLSTKPLHAGEAVSYGYTHRADRDTRVALVTGGYAQGVLRALGNRVSVQIGADVHPVVGRIAMDVCVVDLEGGDVPDGTPVTFFGGDGRMRDALSHWAAVTGLTALEIAVVIGRHAPREWSA